MEINELVENYNKELSIGLSQVEKGLLSQEELNKNLLDGACLELVKDFLANGVGRNKTKMKDAGRTSLHKSTHIRAMLNRVNERWIDFSSQVGINQPGYFKDFLNGFHPKLHSIWLSDGN